MPYTFKPHPVVVNAQKHDVEIIGDIELLHRVGDNLKTIGITGTNGKSTTTALMVHALNTCGMKALMGGNIGRPVFDLDLPADNEVLVLEISSYQMDLCPTFRPDIAVLLNITPDHLDRHGSMEEYIAAKEKILGGEGAAVIAVDDDFTQTLFDTSFSMGQRKTFPVSTNLPIVEGHYVSNGKLFENTKGEDIELADLNNLETLRGVHNHQNALCVYRVLRELGLPHDQIIDSFKTYPGLVHRQYLVRKIGQVTYINDSKATNAEAAAKALSSYENIYWILGGVPKDGGLRGLNQFASKIKKAYVIGKNTKEFAQWLADHDIEHEQSGTMDKAVQQAHQEAQTAGEEANVVLSPACASFDQYSSFEKRGDAFVEFVQQLEQKESAA